MSLSFDTLMVYTTETGGPMHVLWTTREAYDEVRDTGRLTLWTLQPGVSETVDVKMVALAPVEDMRDFVLDPVKEMSA